MNIKKLTPSVDKKILILLAGTMWCGVGIMLVRYAVIWLSDQKWQTMGLFYVIGVLLALFIYRFGFIKIADKNLKRLMPLSESRCVFSFITLKSYLIIVIMITLGIILKHSIIPHKYLSILYTGIGIALFIAGIRYFKFFLG